MDKTRESITNTSFTTRQIGDEKYIEGYFIVFNQYTKLWDGFYEQISPKAVSDLSNVRALYNHNHDLVLGSTTNKTLTLTKDDYGLKGSIRINENDRDALNAYERIKRGDVKGCSFGFELLKENVVMAYDGSFRSTVESMHLFEVSPCVFPAYSQTTINARKKDMEKARAKLSPQEHKRRQTNLLASFKKLSGERVEE